MFEKVLIADRGEVVFRIARTCERLGIATCAVFAEAETGAPHATACDEAICIGAQRTAYLDVAAVLAAARQCGAQAIHPGYGALGRDPEAAAAIAAAGLTLIAPATDLLAKLADPLQVLEVARLAGVRALPIARLTSEQVSDAGTIAAEVGYPLVARSATESQVCDSEEELAGLLSRAFATPDTSVWLESHLQDPRLLAVQLVSDGVEHVALGDLERSIGLIAEAPAPAMLSAPGRGVKHRTLSEAALRVAREAGVVGPAIAEFQLDTHGRLFFCGLRPGLPPEHALAEMCCTIDLVEIQLRLASGERLPPEGKRAQPTGHAVEAYVLAPESTTGVPLPSITNLRWPMVAPGCLRVETDLAVGQIPAPDDTRLVAKLAAYGQTRHQALLTLDRVLAESVIAPVATNLDFLRQILADEAFRAGQYDAGFVQRLQGELKPHS